MFDVIIFYNKYITLDYQLVLILFIYHILVLININVQSHRVACRASVLFIPFTQFVIGINGMNKTGARQAIRCECTMIVYIVLNHIVNVKNDQKNDIIILV